MFNAQVQVRNVVIERDNAGNEIDLEANKLEAKEYAEKIVSKDFEDKWETVDGTKGHPENEIDNEKKRIAYGLPDEATSQEIRERKKELWGTSKEQREADYEDSTDLVKEYNKNNKNDPNKILFDLIPKELAQEVEINKEFTKYDNSTILLPVIDYEASVINSLNTHPSLGEELTKHINNKTQDLLQNNRELAVWLADKTKDPTLQSLKAHGLVKGIKYGRGNVATEELEKRRTENLKERQRILTEELEILRTAQNLLADKLVLISNNHIDTQTLNTRNQQTAEELRVDEFKKILQDIKDRANSTNSTTKRTDNESKNPRSGIVNKDDVENVYNFLKKIPPEERKTILNTKFTHNKEEQMPLKFVSGLTNGCIPELAQLLIDHGAEVTRIEPDKPIHYSINYGMEGNYGNYDLLNYMLNDRIPSSKTKEDMISLRDTRSISKIIPGYKSPLVEDTIIKPKPDGKSSAETLAVRDLSKAKSDKKFLEHIDNYHKYTTQGDKNNISDDKAKEIRQEIVDSIEKRTKENKSPKIPANNTTNLESNKSSYLGLNETSDYKTKTFTIKAKDGKDVILDVAIQGGKIYLSKESIAQIQEGKISCCITLNKKEQGAEYLEFQKGKLFIIDHGPDNEKQTVIGGKKELAEISDPSSIYSQALRAGADIKFSTTSSETSVRVTKTNPRKDGPNNRGIV